jgi:hypothetical protein
MLKNGAKDASDIPLLIASDAKQDELPLAMDVIFTPNCRADVAQCEFA